MIVDGDRAWEVLRDHPRLAIVARSNRTDRPWHDVAGYLIAEGYDVQLVNKMLDEAHGRPCYDSLAELPEPFDIVDVFRMIPEVPGVVDEAIEVGAHRSCGSSSRSCTRRRSRRPRRPGCRSSSTAAPRSSTAGCCRTPRRRRRGDRAGVRATMTT